MHIAGEFSLKINRRSNFMTSKILVVDDEVNFQDLINKWFRKAIKNGEFQFYFALNGIEALKILESDPDLNIVLTDIRMPLMDGLTLLDRLSKLNRPYKAIVVSAYGDLSNIRIAMNRGASDFIIKPINYRDLEITLRKIVEEYSILTNALTAKSKLMELEIELNVLKTIQEDLLPCDFHLIPDLDIAGEMIPATVVGGDFFDFLPINDHTLAFIIADVSGKNISACLYMAIAKALFRAFCNDTTSCSGMAMVMNNFFSKNNHTSFFLTAFFAFLDVSNGKLVYCNAGHNPPYIISEDGSVQRLASKGGPALGFYGALINSLEPYQESSLILKNKDCLFLYTDGITEAWNNDNEVFSERRLKDVLKSLVKNSSVEVIEAVREAVTSFAGNAPQHDDMAMLAIRYFSR